MSLPSDHATAVFAFLSRGWGLALTVVAAIGLARVWVGVHYPGDTVAGAVIGAFAVGLVVAVRATAGSRRWWSRPARR